MKLISLSLAAISGAGFLFHNQLQTLVNRGTLRPSGSAQHHFAPEGVYYLRTAYNFAVPNGTAHWSAGQELRTAPNTLATNGAVSLTDGRNTALVPEAAVTQDMDDAATLRQMESSGLNIAQQQTAAAPQANQNRIVAGQFHETSLDAPAISTNRLENIVSTAGAPNVYSTYNNTTVVVGATTRIIPHREIIVEQHRPQQRSTPPPVMRNY